MDAVCVRAGNEGGLQALMKRSATEAMWTHCVINCELLAMKKLCPDLSEVMDTVIRNVNYIKTHPLRSRLFFFRIVRRNEGTVSVTPVLR
jgi:hypothetical protein